MATAEHQTLRKLFEDSPFSHDLQEARAAYDGLGAMFEVGPGVAVQEVTLGSRAAERFVLEAQVVPETAILYFHGGGYCIGSFATHRHVCAELCRLTTADVYLLDYRLAPEHPFPAGLDDCVDAYRALSARVSPEHLAIAGDSAGGGLVIATLADLKSSGLAQPAAAYCMSPWVDLRLHSEAIKLKAQVDPVANHDLLAVMAERYLGGHSSSDPRVTPLLADLRGVAPVLVQVGSAEVLLDDAISLARALALADVEVSLQIGAELVHVYPCYYPMLPEGREALRAAGDFITARLAAL